MITGEPMPVEKGAGDKVIGGTVNGTGGLVMRAERVGAETMLAQIVRMVSEARRTRAPIQRLADRGLVLLRARRDPGCRRHVLGLGSPRPGAAPGPRAWSTPSRCSSSPARARWGWRRRCRSWSGPAAGAAAGVLVKNAEALEILERVDTLVVDKTGTLTEGKPRVVSIEPAPGQDAANCSRWPRASKQASEHPLAAAIVGAAREAGLALLPGRGIPVAHRKGVEGQGRRPVRGARQPGAAGGARQIDVAHSVTRRRPAPRRPDRRLRR